MTDNLSLSAPLPVAVFCLKKKKKKIDRIVLVLKMKKTCKPVKKRNKILLHSLQGYEDL